MIKHAALARFADKVQTETSSLLAKPRSEARALPASPGWFGIWDSITQAWANLEGQGLIRSKAAADRAVARWNAAYERSLLSP